MNTVRTNRITRAVIVAMTLLGWFVLSNHCALGQMGRSAQARKTHACCQNGESKQQPADGKQGLACCKAIHVVPSAGAKVALFPPAFVIAVLTAVFTLVPQPAEVLVQADDTGPPLRAASFSELVLHRSLRSHAPPFLA